MDSISHPPLPPRIAPTDMAELTEWLDGLDFSTGWMPGRRIVTAKGAYVITVQPVEFNGVPVRYDAVA